MKDLTLIIPAKQEAESLPIFLNELKQIDCKKLIVLQKEDLETINVVNKIPDIEILEQTNKGYGNALIEGINSTKTKYCCIINADGSMNSKYLSEMYKNCQNKDLIFATRYQKLGSGSNDDDIITFVGNKFFTALGNIFFNLRVSDILFTYILGKTDSFKKLQLKNFDFRICVEIPIKAKKLNLDYECTSSFERVRIGGKKKVNPAKDGLLILFEMIRLFFKRYF